MLDSDYYDDEQIKCDILDVKVKRLLFEIDMIESQNNASGWEIDALYKVLGKTSYELIMYLIEINYADFYPFLTRRLRYWIDNAIRTKRDVIEGGCVVEAIKNNVPAHEMGSLLDKLDE